MKRNQWDLWGEGRGLSSSLSWTELLYHFIDQHREQLTTAQYPKETEPRFQKGGEEGALDV